MNWTKISITILVLSFSTNLVKSQSAEHFTSYYFKLDGMNGPISATGRYHLSGERAIPEGDFTWYSVDGEITKRGPVVLKVEWGEKRKGKRSYRVSIDSDKPKNGTYTEYGDYGSYCTTPYRNGEIYGLQKCYHKSGILRRTSNYRNGKREGWETGYYRTGEVLDKVSFRSGRAEGEKIVYYKDGSAKERIMYQNGAIEGKKRTYYANGVLEFEGDYTSKRNRQNEFISGIWYTPEGVKYKETNNGTTTSYQENGSTTTIDENGVGTSYYESGKIKAIGQRINGNLYVKAFSETGQLQTETAGTDIKTYHPSGALQMEGKARNLFFDVFIWSKSYAEDGKLIELFEDFTKTTYDKNGKITTEVAFHPEAAKKGQMIPVSVFERSAKVERKSEILENGLIKTTYYYNYESNTIKSQGNLKASGQNKPRHGIWKFYAKAGFLSSEISFQEGRKDGYEKGYYSNGQLAAHSVYKAGSLMRYVASYSIDGEELAKNGTGVYRTLHPDSDDIVLEVSISNGRRSGTATWYYPSGQIQDVIEYRYSEDHVNGLRWNAVSSFDSSGNPRDLGTLKDGTGTLHQYNDKGEISRTLTLQNGNVVSGN